MEKQKKTKGLKTRPDGKKDTGRPLLFKTKEDLEKKIEEYFTLCDAGREKIVVSKGVEGVVNKITVKIPYTVTGLASYLGTNRQTLINYEEKEQFFDTIKRAKEKIEADMEVRALMGDSNPTMSIFSMKNNYGWVDKQEVDTNLKGKLDIKAELTEKQKEAIASLSKII